MDVIDVMALACERHMFASHELPLDAELHEKYRDNMRGVLAALREPAVLEALCRMAADPATGCVAYVEISVHRAVDVVDAVLGAALGEAGEVAHEGRK